MTFSEIAGVSQPGTAVIGSLEANARRNHPHPEGLMRW
jgi:hypothetical protein